MLAIPVVQAIDLAGCISLAYAYVNTILDNVKTKINKIFTIELPPDRTDAQHTISPGGILSRILQIHET